MDATDHHRDDEINNLLDFLKFYKWTSIYSAVMLTLILAVFIISEILYG